MTAARRLADLAVGLGVNLQPGQTLRVAAEVGQAPMVRVVAETAYERGARFVDVSWFDPVVQAARVRWGPDDALGEVAPWEVALSLGLSLALIPVLVWLAGRIYSNAVLRSGGRVKLRDALTAS